MKYKLTKQETIDAVIALAIIILPQLLLINGGPFARGNAIPSLVLSVVCVGMYAASTRIQNVFWKKVIRDLWLVGATIMLCAGIGIGIGYSLSYVPGWDVVRQVISAIGFIPVMPGVIVALNVLSSLTLTKAQFWFIVTWAGGLISTMFWLLVYRVGLYVVQKIQTRKLSRGDKKIV